MAQLGATTATKKKNLVESIRFRVPPPPPSVSPRKQVGGGCDVQFCCLKRIFSQNNANFERSAVPSRFMYYCNDSWMDFSADVVETLRTSFLDRKPIIETMIDGAKYLIDLKRMLQIDYLTGNCRSISWIDENDKCFFPQDFFSEEGFIGGDDNNCCNYKNKNNNCNFKTDPISSKRKRGEEPEVSSSFKAMGFDVIEHQRLEKAGPIEWPNTMLLRETERAYLFVKARFLDGIRRVDDGVSIFSINQCKREGHFDKARLEILHKQIEITRAARGISNIVYAWFGASAKDVESILAYGFSMPSKVPATDVYGIGVYLSPLGLPHLSAKLADADDNGVRHLILCRVILGNVEKVESGSQQYHPSSVNFDTGSNDPNNPSWYVVWSTNANMHILPEFVVSFKLSSNMEGQSGPVMSMKYPIEKLLSKISSSLPPSKVREILISFSTYKDGTVPKDAFIRKLRLVAGEEVLRSAIQEIIAFG